MLCYISMKTKIIDLSKTLKPYSNEWIALDPKTMEVVAVGKLPKSVLNKAKNKGINSPVLTHAPQNYGTYIL